MAENLAGDVWVIESGEYEDRMIWGVASSVERAATLVRAVYGPPYLVEWGEPVREGDGCWSLTGQFTRVEGYCGTGPQTFDFTRYRIDQRPA